MFTRRRIPALVLTLALAAAISVVVAWATANLPEPAGWGWRRDARVFGFATPTHDIFILEHSTHTRSFRNWRHDPASFVVSTDTSTRRAIKPEWADPWGISAFDPRLRDSVPQWTPNPATGQTLSASELVYGWPFHCMRLRYAFTITGPRPFRSDTIIDETVEIPTAWIPGADATAVIPIHPVWSALLLNTTFFASILLLLQFAVRSARRALRRRANKCPTCAYDLKNLAAATCPECGQLFGKLDSKGHAARRVP